MKETEKISLGGITDSSTIDYPKKVCAVIYLCGCPLRCPWCQNPELVLEKGCKEISINRIVSQMKKNFIIQGICFTGGEPLMQEETINLLKKLKEETDMPLKVDTNGYFPERLKKALAYLDYVAVDIKAPLDEKYGKTTGIQGSWRETVSKVKKSLNIIKESNVEKEARTTIVPGLNDTEDDIQDIAYTIKEIGFSRYALQQFRQEKTLDPEYMKKESPNIKQMRTLGKKAKEIVDETHVIIVTQENGFEEIK